jgi:hypothetical protein
MRTAAIVFSTVALLMSAPLADAEDTQTKVGEWTITTRITPDQPPNPRCIVTSPAVADAPRFAMDTVPGQSSRKGAARLITFTLDQLSDDDDVELHGVSVHTSIGRDWTPPKARWISDGQINSIQMVIDDNIENVLYPLSTAKSLDIVVPGATGGERSYTLSLTGSRAAIDEFEKCLALIE